MVRVAGLKGMVGAGVVTLSDDGRTPAQQIARLDKRAGELIADQQKMWAELRSELRDAGVVLVESSELSEEERIWLDKEFHEAIFPVLTPLALDPSHPFPVHSSIWVCTLALQLARQATARRLTRCCRSRRSSARHSPFRVKAIAVRFIALENVIGLFLHRLFPGYTVMGSGLFPHHPRQRCGSAEEEAEDLCPACSETLLKRWRRGT